MSQADSDYMTPSVVTTLPAPADRPFPKDPDAALALIKIGRHLEAVDEKLRIMWSTPGGPKFLPAVRGLVEELIELLNMGLPDPDLEEDDPAEEAGDLERSLGSLDHVADQRRWADGANDDREEEHDGREPEEGV